MGQLSCS